MSQSWYRNPLVIGVFLWPLAMAALWFGLPYAGMDTILARAGWMFAVSLLWIVVIVVSSAITSRSNTMLEGMLRKNADQALVGASPENRTEVAQLRQRFLSAIDTLKQSKIGKASGTAALYELPWYVLIGHPSAGKSTAILQSGLSFPLGARGALPVQGVGGTRNCDWFFSTEAVLLDTAGRYSTQAEDRGEWLEFLKLLKKFRPKAPLNGIIVAVSVTELLNPNQAEAANYARQIRQRLNELESYVGLKIPVFLMVTKMDLLPGFTDYFEPMTEDERRQTWGAILHHRQATDFDAGVVVGQHMDLLLEGLIQNGQDRMISHPSWTGRAAFHAFPTEFRGLKQALCAFVGLLVEKDPYHSRPLIRGVHFTSALLEGQPSMGLGHRVAGLFDLAQGGLAPQAVPQNRSYFLQGFFQSSLFPDQFLIGRQLAPARSTGRTIGLLSGIAVAAFFLCFSIWSFVNNLSLISDAEEGLLAARKLSARPELVNRLRGVQSIQLRLERIYRFQADGVPWRMRWGLYSGDSVDQILRAAYFNRMKDILLKPVQANLEAALRSDLARNFDSGTPAGRSAASDQLAAQWGLDPNEIRTADDVYNALKTYLMLGDRKRLEPTHITDQVPTYWKPFLKDPSAEAIDPEVLGIARRLVAFFGAQTQDPSFPLIQTDRQLASEVCAKIVGVRQAQDPLQRAYVDLKASVSVSCLPVMVGKILENRDSDLVAGSYQIPGCFTKAGWEKYQEELEKALDGKLSSSDWVLNCSQGDTSAGLSGDRTANRETLIRKYKEEFDQQWIRFMEGIDILEFRDIAGAASGVARLSDAKVSAIRVLVQRAAYETDIDKAGGVQKAVSKVSEKATGVWDFVRGKEKPPEAYAAASTTGHHFPGLGRIAGGAEGEKSPLDAYFGLLTKLQTRLTTVAGAGGPAAKALAVATVSRSGSELAEAQQWVEGTLASMDEPSRRMLKALLLRPLTRGFSPVLGEAERDINGQWASKVYRVWSDLGDKFPFTDSSNEAPVPEIVKFLKAGDGPLAQFIDKDLAGLVTRRGSSLVPQLWGNQGVRFTPAFLAGAGRLLEASESSLRDGDVSRFDLQATPIVGIQEIQIEIDGQQLVYKNGREEWKPFTWPGTGPPGARIQVISNSGVPAQVFLFPGRLGFLRMLERTDRRGAAGQQTLEWRFQTPRNFAGPAGRDAGEKVDYKFPLRLGFRPVAGSDPLQLLKLRKLGLPNKICP